MRAGYDALVDLLASFGNFLNILHIYAGALPPPTLTNVLVKIIIELISTLVLATKQVEQGRFSEFVLGFSPQGLLSGTERFVGKPRGEMDVEATIQRLDRLTLDEARTTAAQALEVVHGLVQHRRVIMDGELLLRSSLPP